MRCLLLGSRNINSYILKSFWIWNKNRLSQKVFDGYLLVLNRRFYCISYTCSIYGTFCARSRYHHCTLQGCQILHEYLILLFHNHSLCSLSGFHTQSTNKVLGCLTLLLHLKYQAQILCLVHLWMYLWKTSKQSST